MADYAISNVARRVVYTNTGVGPYSFTFEILANTDIAVYRGSTLLTLTTDYSVTINANGTGSITLVTAGTGNITIVGARAIQRTSDYTTGGDLFASTLNTDLDSQTIYAQQVAETAERGLKAPVVDPTDINMTLPAKATRAGTVLAFNATTGNPEAGPSIGSVTTVAAQSANINTVATNIASVNTVAGNNTNINTVAGASTNITTVATNIASVNTNATNIVAIQNASTNATNAANSATAASNAQTAAEAARDATLAAYDSFDDRYLGAKSSNPALDNDGNALLAGALYYNTTVPEMRLYTGSAWVAAYVSGGDYVLKANNLSDLTNFSTARTNLGLGTIATQAASSVSITGGSITGITDLAVADGGTGASTLTGVLKGNGTSAFTAATAGTDFVAPGTATTFTALQTFAGTSSNADLKTSNILETVTVTATAATGTINYDVTTQSVLYYTTNASGNFTVNFRGSSGTSLNTVMSTGESLSVTFLVTNGATAYYNSAVQIDGSSVTPKWQGGTAPTSGNASSIDSYTYVIIKTGSATFTVLASVTKFA